MAVTICEDYEIVQFIHIEFKTFFCQTLTFNGTSAKKIDYEHYLLSFVHLEGGGGYEWPCTQPTHVVFGV
jgi:hypothetical protein